MSECDRDNLFIVILAATNRWASTEGYLWPHLREGTGVTIRSRHPECSECLNVFEQNADKVTSKIPFATCAKVIKLCFYLNMHILVQK